MDFRESHRKFLSNYVRNLLGLPKTDEEIRESFSNLISLIEQAIVEAVNQDEVVVPKDIRKWVKNHKDLVKYDSFYIKPSEFGVEPHRKTNNSEVMIHTNIKLPMYPGFFGTLNVDYPLGYIHFPKEFIESYPKIYERLRELIWSHVDLTKKIASFSKYFPDSYYVTSFRGFRSSPNSFLKVGQSASELFIGEGINTLEQLNRAFPELYNYLMENFIGIQEDGGEFSEFLKTLYDDEENEV